MSKFTKIIAGIVAVLVLVAVSATGASAAFTRSLTIGSTGADVTELQSWLVSKGYLVMPVGVNMGYFGTLTKNAVIQFQTANGITPAAGYFGPISQAKVASMGSMSGSFPAGCSSASGFSTITGASCSTGSTSTVAGCTSTVGFSPTTGQKCDASVSTGGSTSLSGTDGSIDDVTTLSSYNNEQVGEGENNVKVAGFEVKASTDGDIALKSVKLTFDNTGNSGGSSRLNKYIDSVSIYQGSTKVGSASVDDFTKDSSNSDLYSKTITLSNSVVKADAKEKFYISVDSATTLDSTDIADESWTVAVNSIRFEDGSGVVSTDSTTGDLGTAGTTIGSNGTAGDGVPMDFVSFSTSANTELKFSTDTDTPISGPVIIDDTNNTNDVVLTKGKIKVDGTSDVLLNQLPITLTTVGGSSVAAVTGSVKLTIDGNDYTETVNTAGLTGTITFDNLDLTLTAGKTYSYTISADINDIDTGNLDEGDTLEADFTASNRSMLDAENSQGDQLVTAEKSGTTTGEAQIFRTSGIMVTLVSTKTDATTGTSANDDVGLFTIRYTVKAVGDTVYVSSLADATTGALTSGKTSIAVDKGGTATSANSMNVALVNVTDTTLTSVGNYQIEDGSSETFEISVSVPLGTNGTSGQYRAALAGISYAITDIYPVATPYTSNLDTFKTSYEVLN